ncbi:hypothetical protein GEMRC1_000242 [Eukaryota sp. GEM-RC1]
MEYYVTIYSSGHLNHSLVLSPVQKMIEYTKSNVTNNVGFSSNLYFNAYQPFAITNDHCHCSLIVIYLVTLISKEFPFYLYNDLFSRIQNFILIDDEVINEVDDALVKMSNDIVVLELLLSGVKDLNASLTHEELQQRFGRRFRDQ